jgi:hypothetical protein
MLTLDNPHPLAFFRPEGGITAGADRKLIAPQHFLHGNCCTAIAPGQLLGAG